MDSTALPTLRDYRAIVPDWASRPCLMGLRGSHAHNTYLPPDDDHGTDDVDLFAVTVQSPEFYSGLGGYHRKRDRHDTAGDDLDVLVYDVRKFVDLLCKGNPNVHMWLWTRQDHVLHSTEAGRWLLRHRQQFFSRALIKSTWGYAMGQRYKMERPSIKGYMGAKRKALFERHGYDVKNASHVLRILLMGVHLLKHGELRVALRGRAAQSVRLIKGGHWTLAMAHQEIDKAAILFEELEAAHGDNFSNVVSPATAEGILREVIRCSGVPSG